MPFPGGTYIHVIRQIGAHVADEFEQFYALLQGWLSFEHDENGRHTRITGTSITLTGNGSFDGDVTAQASDTISKCRMGEIIDASTGLAGTGITSGIHLGGTKGWVVGLRLTGSPGSPADSEIRLFDLNHLVAGVSALRLFYYTANSWWTLGVETGGALALGEDAAGKRLQEVNTILARASTGYYERSRATLLGDWTAYTPSWTSGGLAVTIGGGTLSGWVSKAGTTVHFRILAAWGAGSADPNPGSAWIFSFPSTAVAGGTQLAVGAGIGVYAGGVYASWQCILNTATTFAVYSPGTAAAVSATLTNANPAAVAAGDTWWLEGSYEET